MVPPCIRIQVKLLSLSSLDSSNHYPSEFVSPAAIRSSIRKEHAKKYNVRKDAEQEESRRKEQRKRDEDELAVSKVFA